jgi:hypothetical protein
MQYHLVIRCLAIDMVNQVNMMTQCNLVRPIASRVPLIPLRVRDDLRDQLGLIVSAT